MKPVLNWKMFHRTGFILIGLMFCGWLTSQAANTGTRIVAWGENNNGQIDVPQDLTNAVFIAAGGSNSLAIRADGMVVVWGFNGFGLTNVPFTMTKTVAAAIGSFHVLVLRTNGFVRAWGANYFGQASVPADLSNVVAIAAGGDHSLALTAEGKVVGWGHNILGYNNVPDGLSNVVAIATSDYGSRALTADGKIVMWGNLWGPVGLSNVVQIVGGGSGAFAALDANGRADFLGDEVFAGVSNKAAIQVGDVVFGPVGLTEDGRVLWEENNWDPLPPETTNVVAIAAGSFHGLALIDPTGGLTSWRMPPPALSNGQAVINISTHRGRSYVLESRSLLGTNGWTVEKRFAGDGSLRQFSFSPVGQTFYRARRFP